MSDAPAILRPIIAVIEVISYFVRPVSHSIRLAGNIMAGHAVLKVFAGFAAPMPLSPDWLVAHELLWWSEDKSGLHLRNAFRNWAKEQGVNEIKWSCRSSNARVMRFYTKTSKPSEAVFSEVLPCAFQAL